jgi:hypothetical protein
MAKRIRQGLNFSNVVALLALFVALGGTVYAAAKIDGKNIKKNSVTGKQVNEDKLKQVPSAAEADSAATSDHATTAGSASTAGSAQPVAFAHIAANGGIDANRSKGVGQLTVDQPIPGFYCLTGMPAGTKGAIVTPERDTFNSYAEFNLSATTFCPEGGQVRINDSSSSGGSSPFQIVFFG